MKSTTGAIRSKWTTLEHRGVAFPPEYSPRGISISIAGEKLSLNQEQEELVYAWAKKRTLIISEIQSFNQIFLPISKNYFLKNS